MAQYGRTWWGEQWLKALDRIDFSNRLPRGKSYANKGMVHSIKINENTIQAKVKGSLSRPYSITVIVPPFFEEEQKILIENIKNNPLLLSQLLNRQLPQELLSIAEAKGIKIFPQSWQDIKLNCSCPDWAVPCKHLAAVIYTIANEIDQNPFLVFNLHRFKLMDALSSHQMKLNELQAEKIFSLKDCIDDEKRKKQREAKENFKLETPDFSLIENILPTLPLLFTSSPLFYDKDFKTLIQNNYKRLAKCEAQYVSTLKKNKEDLSNDYRYYEYSILINELINPVITGTDTEGKMYKVPFKSLLVLLATTESKHLESYSASFVLLYRSFRFCKILAERGALLPRLFLAGKDKYKVQWIPALLNASVKKVFDDLLQWYPEDLAQLSFSSPDNNKTAEKKLKQAKPEHALSLICSLFSNASVQDCYNTTWRSVNAEIADGWKILQLFFDDTIVEFKSFSEKEIPNTIQLWLNRFYISKKDYAPVLQVYEKENNEGFEVEVLMKDNVSPLKTVESLFSFMDSKSDKQFSALKDLQLLSHYMPGLDEIIASKGKKKLNYSAHTFAEVLTGILPAIRLFGIQTLLPKSLQHLLKPQVSMSLSIAKGKNKSYLSLTGLMDFDWQVAMGNAFISKEEFMRLAKQSSGLIKIRDEYVLMNEEEIEKIIKKLTAPSAPKAFTLLQAALSGDYEGAPVQIDKSLQAKLNDILKTDDVALPGKLNVQLRHYQQRGYSWMYKNAQLGIGSLLADDMGLGKTVQVITALQKFKEEGLLNKTPALVIAPTTLLSNWKKEIEKFAPTLQATIFHGTNRKAEFTGSDVIITTYGIARTENIKLSKQKWHVLIVDEAQNIKNSEIAQTKSVKKIDAPVKIAMTGTPVENRLMEYWSILDFANPGYLGNTNWFNEEYAKPIEINQDKKRLDKFRKITSPFIMRRLKTDKSIIGDLPDKIENDQYCNLSKEQASLYESITSSLLKQVEEADGMNRRGLILKLLTVLKQVCNHPVHYLKNNDDPHSEQSGKMMLMLQLLETIYENNEKVLIFSQYKEMGGLLRSVIHNHFGKKALQLHGGNSRKERDEMVQSFQNNPLSDTFILSLKAGGTGLNLTSGNHVIHYDLWWNPAAEAQATDRAFRIGQQKNVMVHRLITKGTLEEKIDSMLRSKKQLANLTVATGEKWIGELSDMEIKQLVKLGE
ncbi:MAG TPA: SNF2-related protein [Chitinophagaceae bacterium]|nr:SNF2-related protein [Chitinophagaceae bacterium]